ncbi:MAG TPA: hypothetical protein VI299_17340, partial [Polyangiales bacterium]
MQIRSVLLSLWLLAWAACATPASPTTQKPSQPAVVEPTPGLFLYEVRSERGSVLLLGTIHMGFGFDEVLTPTARARFQAATHVMTEADVAAADPARLIQAALLPPDRSLK